MALDPRFIVTSDLESYFVDKDSGEPLSGGIVTFYSDLNRSVKKPVYELTGSPPNYGYSPLPNPCYLSIAGTFQDELGNNIVPYYYPFEGTPDENSSSQELYFITVQNSGGVLQFTREGWPNNAAGGSTPETVDEINFIPNGQFLAHNDIVSATQPPVETFAFGAQTLTAQAIAQGGWYFVRNSGGTGTYDNSFERTPTGVGLNDYPRYAFNFKCTNIGNDQTRDLQIRWPDVNKFSAGNPVGSVDYTYTFSAQSNTGSSYTFNVYLIRYFGSGGAPSTPTETLLTTISVTPSVAYLRVVLLGIEGNLGTLGTNNDDFIAISIRGVDNSWDAQFTDFSFLAGDVNVLEFPVQTNASMLSEGVAGFMPTPNPNGTDLYLPLVLTPSGMTFDHSEVGSVVPSFSVNAPGGNLLLCDGTSYNASEYSTIGIPYSRLRDKIYSSTYKAPIFGGGYQYVNAYAGTANTSLFRIATNSAGTITAAADTGGTTFTVTEIHAGQAATNVRAYQQSAATVLVRGNYVCGSGGSAITAVNAGTSGFAVGQLRSLPGTYQYFTINPTAAAGLAGLYFTFHSSSSNSAPTNNAFYVWFTVNGAGVPPVVAGTEIKVNLLSTWGFSETGQAIREAINGARVTSITTVAEASVPQSSYFVFYGNPSSAQQYVVWYNKNGAGVQPTVAGAKYIEVAVTTGDTAATIANNTLIAINRAVFGVPDFRGVVLRGLDNTTTPQWDVDVATRLSNLTNAIGGALGSIEYDELLSHIHGVTVDNSSAAGTTFQSSSGTGATNNTNVQGNSAGENQVVTAATNYYMKY